MIGSVIRRQQSRRGIVPALAGVLAGIGAIGSAQAAPIALTNPSFETPAGPPYVQGGSQIQNGQIPGWTFQADGASGQNDRDVATYPLSTGALPGGSGSVVGFFNLDSPGSQAQAFDNVDAGYTVNTQYTVTVALGNPSRTAPEGYRDPGKYRIQLLAQSGSVIATSPDIYATATLPAGAPANAIAGNIADGQLKDFSFVFTTPAAAGTAASQQDAFGNPIPDYLVAVADYNAIRIQIQAVGLNGAEQASFDDVRLDATSVPEPTTAGLLTVAMLALGRRRRA